jgi:hypothetical protein
MGVGEGKWRSRDRCLVRLSFLAMAYGRSYSVGLTPNFPFGQAVAKFIVQV